MLKNLHFGKYYAYKYIIIFLLLLSTSCKKEPLTVPADTGQDEYDTASLTLSGRVMSTDLWATTFRVQLIKGKTGGISEYENDTIFPDAQLFVTQIDSIFISDGNITIPINDPEANYNNFKFNNLAEGDYTLYITKKGYKPVVEHIEVRTQDPNFKTITADIDKNAGFTGKLHILGEGGEGISQISFHRNTYSVFFYLFNGKGTSTGWNIRDIHEYIGKYYLVNNASVLLESDWIKEIKPSSSGTLKPNEIILIEVVIDPLIYTLREHSSCKLVINHGDYNINLTY